MKEPTHPEVSVISRPKRVSRVLVAITTVFGLTLVGAAPVSAAVDPTRYGAPTVDCYLTSDGRIGPIGVWPNFAPLFVDGLDRPRDYEQMYYQPWVYDIRAGRWLMTSSGDSPYPWVRAAGTDAQPYTVPGTAVHLQFEAHFLAPPLRPSRYYVALKYAWSQWTGTSWTSWSFAWTNRSDYRNFNVLNGAFFTQGNNCDTQGSPGVVVTFNTLAQSRVNRLSQRGAQLASRPHSNDSEPSATRPEPEAPDCFGKTPTIIGTEDAEVLVGTRGRDVIVGLGGDDTIFGGGGHTTDVICAGDGADGVLGGPGRDLIAGDGGDDVLLGESGMDNLRGGEGIDYIEPGPGIDQADGGGSSLDILSYLSSSTGVDVAFSTGRALGEGRDTFRGFNVVVGSDGADSLTGSTGQEFFIPLGGADVVEGGSGSDAILYALSPQGVNVNLASGSGLGEGADTLGGLEVVDGSSFDDVIVGDDGYNWLSGGDGNDHLDGVAGDDSLDAGNGVDVCENGLIYLGCENQGGDVLPVPSGSPPSEGTESPPTT
jgi:hypothetical protein